MSSDDQKRDEQPPDAFAGLSLGHRLLLGVPTAVPVTELTLEGGVKALAIGQDADHPRLAQATLPR